MVMRLMGRSQMEGWEQMVAAVGWWPAGAVQLRALQAELALVIRQVRWVRRRVDTLLGLYWRERRCCLSQPIWWRATCYHCSLLVT